MKNHSLWRAGAGLMLCCFRFSQGHAGDDLFLGLERSELNLSVRSSLQKLGLEASVVDIDISTDNKHVVIDFNQYPAVSKSDQKDELFSTNSVDISPDEAVNIVVEHLREIKKEGSMSNRISTTEYWKGVFYEKGKIDLFPQTVSIIQNAVESGLKPYREKGRVSADEFADLALAAVNSKTQK